MASEDRVLGRIGITLKGEYDNNKTYTKLNQVTHQGGSYTLKVAKAKGILPTNEDYWICSARPGEKGDKGDKGEKGDTGAQGPQGEQGIQGIQGEQGEKGDKGDKPVSGVDYFTEEEKEIFKQAVVKDSKTEIDTHTADKITEFNNNATEKINTFNSNAEEKIADYNAHVETLTSRIADLEEETEDLYNALPIEEASGTELYIEDAKPCRVINTEIGGMYKQNRTKGLNFFDITGYTDRTVNGINIKVNDDGTLTLNGVCTVEKTFVNISIPEHIIPAGTYTRYMSYAENIKSFLTLALSYNNTTIPNTSVQPNNQYTTSTYNDDITYNQIKLYIPNTNVTFNNIIVDPMLVRGEYTANNAPKYEPYTGGNPSPNPDYPQAIEQVESVKLNIRGKNLCDGINQNYYLTNNVDICGKVTGNSGLAIDVQDKSYVTISTKITQDRYRIACTNSLLQEEKATTVAYRGVQKDNTSATVTINTTGYKYLIINATDLSSILVENGSVATEYEPYQNQAINIDLKGNKLCAISNTIKGKLLIDRSGNVVLQKNVNKYIFTGNENSIINSTTDSYNEFTCVIPNLYPKKYFETKSNKFLYNLDNRISISDTGASYIRTPIKLQIDTIDKFKTIIKDTEVYYVLATPEIIDLGQLIELPKTFEGINNIWAETNLGNTEIEIEYVQDVKKLLEKQAEQQNARLDSIEALLSTTETSALLLDNMQTDLEKEVE